MSDPIPDSRRFSSTIEPPLLVAAAFHGFVAIGLQTLVAYLTSVARSHHRSPRPDHSDNEPENIALVPNT